MRLSSRTSMTTRTTTMKIRPPMIVRSSPSSMTTTRSRQTTRRKSWRTHQTPKTRPPLMLCWKRRKPNPAPTRLRTARQGLSWRPRPRSLRTTASHSPCSPSQFQPRSPRRHCRPSRLLRLKRVPAPDCRGAKALIPAWTARTWATPRRATSVSCITAISPLILTHTGSAYPCSHLKGYRLPGLKGAR